MLHRLDPQDKESNRQGGYWLPPDVHTILEQLGSCACDGEQSTELPSLTIGRVENRKDWTREAPWKRLPLGATNPPSWQERPIINTPPGLY